MYWSIMMENNNTHKDRLLFVGHHYSALLPNPSGICELWNPISGPPGSPDQHPPDFRLMVIRRVWRLRSCEQMTANKPKKPYQAICYALRSRNAGLCWGPTSITKFCIYRAQSPEHTLKFLTTGLKALVNQKFTGERPPQHRLVRKGVVQKQHNFTFACKSLLWRTSVGHHITTTHLSDKSRVKQGEGAKSKGLTPPAPSPKSHNQLPPLLRAPQI